MRRLTILALALVSAFVAAGCGSKEVDPGAKVDAPGYYNGPMEPRGGGQGAGDAKTAAPEGTTGG